MITLKINYKSNSSELCQIGKKYDTDKSSQRENVTDTRHCHPYTLFYESLFKNNKNDNLTIAEIGILYGSSLLMWREYFQYSQIYGFEYDTNLLQNFKKNFNNERIHLSNIDVTNEVNIKNSFNKLNIMYDIIIEDSTHQFEDQIRVIYNIHQYLKPGGILIIEDIFKSYNEEDYINRLAPILSIFQDFYFVELDHINRKSTGWNNDKLFILVKGGGEPIFKNNNKITIITPSIRTENILKIYKSINFHYVDEWIIVYDGNKISENPNIFETKNDKIKEFVYKEEDSTVGNSQRNFALSKVSNDNTILYYLDDDNIVHPSLYRLLNIIDNTRFYTFNQVNRVKGDNPKPGLIDTACLLIPYKLSENIKWVKELYHADGIYINKCYKKNREVHIYIDNDLCYYNYLNQQLEPVKIQSQPNLITINNQIQNNHLQNSLFGLSQMSNTIPLRNKNFMNSLF